MSEQIQKIGNYILLEKLAVGGMAEVFLAKMISSDKLVAIKKVLPNHAATTEYIKLFQEEVRVSLNLKHGNIVSFFDFITEKNEMYLVMEFVNGLTLRKLIGDLKFKKSKLSYAQSLYVVGEVAEGLDHAHRSVDSVTNKKLNVIHRDINPHNIMIGFDGCIKIIDFGIAKADSRADETKIGTIKGKFSYMSPEQASAKPLDCRTDVYALGVVLWELLTGQKMHAGKNDLETLKKIRTAIASSPREIDPRIPVEIESVVMKALERDPNLRYQKAADFRHELSRLLASRFPEFRPVIFSEFVGGMYSELIKSRVEKLSYFARVKFDSSAFVASTRRGKRSASETTVMRQVELPEGFESSSNSSNPESLNFQELKKTNDIFAVEVKNFTKQKAANFFAEAHFGDEEEKKGFHLTKILENSILWNLKHLALIVIVIYAAFSFYRQFFNPNVSKEILLMDQSSEAEVVTPSTEAAGRPRPAFAPVPHQEDFSSKFFKSLKASGKLSFAQIIITNDHSSDTKIFVNSKLIYDKSQVTKFPVYANQETTITAYNARLNLYDEQKVVIPSGKIEKVKLFLRPYQQTR